MSDEYIEVPTCPGCHFGCQLDDYQCARGERLFGQWCNGEEIPERRMPGPGGAQPAGNRRSQGMPPFLKRLMEGEPGKRGDSLANLVSMLSRRVHSSMPGPAPVPSPFCPPEDKGIKVLEALMRHEGAASSFVVSGRTSMDEEEVESIADEELLAGTLEIDQYEDGTVFMRITDVGTAKLQEAKDAKSALNEEIFECLTDDEQEQLSELLRRVVEESFK